MPFTTLISAAELAPHLDDPDWAVVDCRFSFADAEQGRCSAVNPPKRLLKAST